MADIGYKRISICEFQVENQLENVKLDLVYEETISSSTKERPILADCLAKLVRGDVLHIQSIDRISRNLQEFEALVIDLNKRGIALSIHSDNISFTVDTDNEHKMLFKALNMFSRFDTALTRERQQEGIQKAKNEGKHVGRPIKILDKDKEAICKKLNQGYTAQELATEYGLAPSSIYKIKSEAFKVKKD